MEQIAAHVDLVLENNNRLQQIIASGELQYKSSSPYAGHPDLEAMKRELEREKGVLKNLFGDFEEQQAAIARRERELNAQYMALTQQIEEQYALQSSTAKIVEDYQDTIQGLNKKIAEDAEYHQQEMEHMQMRADGYEERVNELQGQLDEARDLLRGNSRELEEKDMGIVEMQEKLKKTQRQLSQLRMETLEARVGPHSGVVKDGTMGEGIRSRQLRSTSRRSLSATYASANNDITKPPEFVFGQDDLARRKSPTPGNFCFISANSVVEEPVPNNVLSPRPDNVEDVHTAASKAPGQDAIARRAAAAKRLEERQRNREKMGKENSWM